MEITASEIFLDSTGISAGDVVAVARRGARVRLSSPARDAITRSAAIVEALAERDDAVYGISTGFGSLATTVIPTGRREELQRALIRSHAAGMGPLVEPEVVRAMMVLRARTLAMGFSGVRQVVVDTILALLNADIVPSVHEHGPLGASGDLAPLAHVALALIGEGDCAEAMAAAGIAPVTLRAKEGLALINGTDGMLGMLVLALADLDMLVRTADVAAAMSVEALMATDRAFAADLMALRPHAG
jgi:histidine ammonia-lyase